MADDLRARLSDALDENQREIDGREGARVVPLKFRGEWRAADMPLAEALVERDRQTIRVYDQWARHDDGAWCRSSLLAAEQELRRAAAFWLGTQESDR